DLVSANSTPFGAGTLGGTGSLATPQQLLLDTGFLGTVELHNRANGSSVGTTTIRSGVLELHDALAVARGAQPPGTFSTNTPTVNIEGGQLNIFVNEGGNTQPASSNVAGFLNVNSSGTLAINSPNDSRTWNGTITIAAGQTLHLNSLTGFQMNLTGTG